MKVHVKASNESLKVFKTEAKRDLKENDGSFTLLCEDAIKQRKHQRHLYLVYGFIRGRAYCEIERKTHTKPDWRLFRKLAYDWGVRKPYFRGCGWYGLKPHELLSKNPPCKLMEYVLENWEGDLPDYDSVKYHYWSHATRVGMVRTLFPKGEAGKHMESYLRMEEWIVDAEQHLQETSKSVT